MRANHLNEAEIAIIADALNCGNTNAIPKSLMDHLAECDQCAHEVALVAQLSNSTVNISQSVHKSKAKMLILTGSVAASLLLFLTFKFIIPHYQTTRFTQSRNNIKQVVDTIPVPLECNDPLRSPQQKIAQYKQNYPDKAAATNKKTTVLIAYNESPDLEKLVNRFKGSTLRGDNIKIISPNIIETSGSQIKLEWVNNDNQDLMVEFYNNLGEKIEEQQTSADFLILPKFKAPGLYYWKLLNDDFDLLFCGKIIVRVQ